MWNLLKYNIFLISYCLKKKVKGKKNVRFGIIKNK